MVLIYNFHSSNEIICLSAFLISLALYVNDEFLRNLLINGILSSSSIAFAKEINKNNKNKPASIEQVTAYTFNAGSGNYILELMISIY